MRRLLALVLLAACLFSARVRAEGATKLEAVEIEGRLIDPKDKLLRFLGLQPGVVFDEHLQQRISDDLSKYLGYHLIEARLDPGRQGLVLRLKVEPMRVVRNIWVHGNWPLFNDEIIRHLTVRSGSRLRPDEELQAFLDDEAARVRSFLDKDGYFGSQVKIVPHRGPRDEWIDLDVQIELGEWFKLGTIDAEGNTAISRQELFDAFEHCCFRWGRFELSRMRDDARDAERKLRDRGYPAARVIPEFDFSRDADPKTHRIKLPVKVTEKKRVEVKFVGNRAIADKELREQLTLFSAGAYDEVELQESARAVQRDYQKHGFFESRVTFQRHRTGPDVDEVTFFVTEGPELKVRSVEFVSEDGRPLTFSQDEIRGRAGVETRVFPRLGSIGLGQGGYVTDVQLQQDADRVAQFYKSRGFSQVKVRPEVTRDPASFGALGALGAETAGAAEGKNDLYVRFYIDEGPQQVVDHLQIVFVGPHKMTEAEVRKALKLTGGQPFTTADLDEDKQRLLNLYRSSARPYLAAAYEEEPHGARIKLRLVINEGPAVTFGDIVIRGNFKTRDRVILKDLPFKPGDPFNYDRVLEGQSNLQRHLVFTTAKVEPLLSDVATTDLEQLRNPVPVVVTVQERYLEKLGSLAIAAGIATDKLPNYVYVSAGWIYSNFFGLGSQLELRGDFGFDVHSWGASLRYTDARAFGPGWRFDLTGFIRDEVTYRFGPIQTFGASTALTRSLSIATRLFLRYDIYQAQIFVPFVRLEGSHDVASVQDNTVTGKITTGVVWDRRVGLDGQPNPLMPVKGWLLSASLGWATPYLGGDHQFVVFSGQALGILPFKIRNAEFTLIGNLRYDEGIPIGEPALPQVERFFGGGDTTTRGYDVDQLKSEIVRADVAPLSGQPGFRVVAQGGDIRLLTTVEVQFPIAKTFLGLQMPWVGALFWDMGAIADAPNLIQGSDFKHAVGISLLRILTPVGPLSLEYAYPITQTLAEERWKDNPWYSHFPGRIHFNWGIPLSRL
jgi:outer membrane protein insertion porin family